MSVVTSAWSVTRMHALTGELSDDSNHIPLFDGGVAISLPTDG